MIFFSYLFMILKQCNHFLLSASTFFLYIFHTKMTPYYNIQKVVVKIFAAHLLAILLVFFVCQVFYLNSPMLLYL